MTTEIVGSKNPKFYDFKTGKEIKFEEVNYDYEPAKINLEFKPLLPIGQVRLEVAEEMNLNIAESLLEIIQFELIELLEIVSLVTKIAVDDILSKSRKKEIVSARHLFSFVANDYGTPKIAISRALKEDHSTTIHAIKKIKNELELYSTNPDNKTIYFLREIEEKIKDLMVEKIIFAALAEQRRIEDAS